VLNETVPKLAFVAYKFVLVEFVIKEDVANIEPPYILFHLNKLLPRSDVKLAAGRCVVEVRVANVVFPTTFNVPVKIPLLPVKPFEERFVVDALVNVAFVEKRDDNVAPVALKLVVEALLIVAIPVVFVFVKVAPVADKLVVLALVIVAFVIVAPVALKFVVDAFNIVAIPVVFVFVNVAPVAERFVVEAFIAVNPFTNALVANNPVAERFVVLALVIIAFVNVPFVENRFVLVEFVITEDDA